MFRKVIALLLTVVLAFSIVACNGNGPDSDTTIEPEQSAVPGGSQKTNLSGTLDIWIMPNSAVPDEDFLELIKPFTDANPNVKVTPTVLDWGSAWTKITAAATSGNAPDITQLGTTWVGAVTSMGALLEITDKVDYNRYIPAVLETTGLHGTDVKTCVPWFVETRALFYRKDACEKVGVDPAKDFATWESFEAALVKLNNVEVDGKKLPALGMPGKNDWNVTYNFTPWIYGAGGDFLDPEAKKAIFNSPEALEGIKFYSELAVKGLMDKAALEKNTNDIDSGFVNGNYATSFMGPWNISTLERNKETGENSLVDKVGVAMIPEGPKGRKAFLGGSTLAIFKSSKNQEAAIALVNFLSEKDPQVAYAKKTGNLPSNKEAYADPFIDQHPMRSVFKAQMEYAKAYPAIASWGPAEIYFQQGLSLIWDNAMDIGGPYSFETTKKTVDGVVDQVDTLLQQNQ